MQTIRKFGRFTWDSSYCDLGHTVPLYVEGKFKALDVQGRVAYYIKTPILFEAYGTGVQGGIWLEQGRIDTFCKMRGQVEYRPDAWTVDVWWEFWGLVAGIAALNKAYEFARFGNHTVGNEKAVVLKCKDMRLARAIANKLDTIIVRANELLALLPAI